MPTGDSAFATTGPTGSSIDVEVLYFAALRDLSGVGTERVGLVLPPSGGARVDGLLAALEARHEGLRGRLQSVRVAVNEEFVDLSTELHGGEVVALIPPVSGG